MKMKRLSLLLACAAVAIVAFVTLDYWSQRNAPLRVRFERQWQEDVRLLESSPKLPRAWFDVAEVETFGGTPETRAWLRRTTNPIQVKNKNGAYKLEVLVVAWEEEGVHGVLVQYNLIHRPSQNMVWELGRSLILAAASTRQ